MSQPLSASGVLPNCVLCKDAILESGSMYIPPCGHPLHSSCLAKIPSNNLVCPVCDGKLKAIHPQRPSTTGNVNTQPPPTIVTRARAQVQRALEYDNNRSNSVPPTDTNISFMSTSSPQGQRDQLQSIVSAAVKAQQAEMLSTLSQHLTKLIETNIEAGFQRLNLSTQSPINTPTSRQPSVSNQNPQILTLPAVEQQTLEQLLGLPSNRNSSVPNTTISNSSTVNSSLRSDKVGHIIHNWKIRFTGDSKGIPVENFIYRVEALTKQTLGGNFDILCDHISTLFESKASDWFWRHHKACRRIVWPELCGALREQYKDSRTDVDFREMIRDRKQKPGESFDLFYEAIIDISDRLTIPLAERVLVEILRRNLLPEIQHELLNLEINSISQLRDICRKREFFMQDVGKKHGLSKSLIPRRQVYEMYEDDVETSDEEISAISLVCWNCQKSGHRFQDCLDERRVFCYGCGAANAYKPTCTNCNGSKNLRSSAPKSARKQTRSTYTSTD
ncbi:hypothetical protein CVS40_7368 [Lucilia cuprina]|nr:hypothetical protein CVS40_7368 [Lucilia cuprina]